jgi:exoribonuclease-2
VVRSPERWEKIVTVAAELGEKLPPEADAKSLEEFLRKRRAADPVRFPDLSLVVVKLMGNGEYVVDVPGEEPIGHFGLAVRDYSHTTAPNRRFPDILTHRLLKACLAKRSPPYGVGELDGLARHCTEMESAAAKVESRVGESFDGVITGAADKGTFVRVFDPPVEGRVVRGERSLKVGAKVRVTLVATDFEKGFLDFVRN